MPEEYVVSNKSLSSNVATMAHEVFHGKTLEPNTSGTSSGMLRSVENEGVSVLGEDRYIRSISVGVISRIYCVRLPGIVHRSRNGGLPLPDRSIAGNLGSNSGCIGVLKKESLFERKAGAVMHVVFECLVIYFDGMVSCSTN